jgi:hypothetical protein
MRKVIIIRLDPSDVQEACKQYIIKHDDVIEELEEEEVELTLDGEDGSVSACVTYDWTVKT